MATISETKEVLHWMNNKVKEQIREHIKNCDCKTCKDKIERKEYPISYDPTNPEYED